MKCWHCGKELRDGQPFCDQCGAEQRHPPESDLDDVGREEKDAGPSGGGNWASPTPPSPSSGLKIAGLVFAVLYTVVAGNTLVGVATQIFGTVASFLTGSNLFYTLFSLLSSVMQVALTVVLVGILLMLAFRKTGSNWHGLMLALAAVLALRVVVQFVLGFLTVVLLHAHITSVGAVLGTVLVRVLFGVLTVAVMGAMGVSSGEPIPVINRDQEELKDSLYIAMGDAQAAAQEVLGKLRSKANSGPQPSGNPPYSEPPHHGYTYQDQTNQGYPHYQPPDPGRYTYQGYGTPYQTPYAAAGFRLQEDRNLWKYILLNLVTCGICSLYFHYCWARDVNIACNGDGQHTGGLLAWILLSTLTCGIYPLYWYYALGNRLQLNGRRYGMEIREGGGTILLWILLGLFTCGLCSLYAFYLLLRNTNYICIAYNRSRM